MLVGAVLLFGFFPPLGFAQGLQFEERPDFWDLELGTHWSELPEDFQEFACGTNGGPPSVRLTGFHDFATCRPEDNGLYEVQFRYDDTLEYWARAMEFAPLVEVYAGTKLFTFPVILSALFDIDGILRGLRAVTDDRVTDRVRQLAYSIALPGRAFFLAEGWICIDLPINEGEQPMAGRLVKEDCWKRTEDGRTVRTHSRLLLREGQSLLDPADNRVRTGLFESIGRLEIFDPTVEIDLPSEVGGG